MSRENKEKFWEGPDPREGFGVFCGLEPGEIAKGEAVFRCRIDQRHLNPHGIAHGGILFTLMDTAAGTAAATLCGASRGLVTQCAGIHFLRPALPGLVTARAQVLKSGRRTALVIAEIFDEAEKRLSYADFEIFYLDKKET